MRGLRRTACALLLLLLTAATLVAEPVDMVVLLDTSTSMLPYYEDLVEYLIRGILRDYLRFGDTFHLIAFAGDSTVEIIQDMGTTEDIEAVLRHILLIHPLGPYTDLVRAFRFLHAYVQRLPEQSRKTILVMTDGRHEPPPGSPYDLDADAVRSELFETARTIRRQGWEVRLLRLPSGDEALGLQDSLPPIQVPPDDEIPDQQERLAEALEPENGAVPEADEPDAGTEGLPSSEPGPAAPPQEPTDDAAPSPETAAAEDDSKLAPEAQQRESREPAEQPATETAEPSPSAEAAPDDVQPAEPGPGVGPAAQPESETQEPPADDGQAPQEAPGPTDTAEPPAEGREPLPSEDQEQPSAPDRPEPATQPTGEGTTEGDGQTEEDHLPELSEELDAPLLDYDEDRQEELTSEALGIPQVTFPGDLGSVHRRFIVPLGIRNFSDERISLTLTRMEWEDTNILRRSSSVSVQPGASATLRAPVALPTDTAPGARTIRVRLTFRNDLRVSPSTGELTFVLQVPEEPAVSPDLLRSVWIGLLALVILAALVVFFLLARRAADRRGRPAAQKAETLPQVYYHEGKLHRPIEMRVVGQNPNVGMRNIHTLRPGARLSVGGRGDAFLIFLVRVPGHVAELRFDGTVYTFVPVKPEFFPELSAPLPSFLGQPITLLSKDGRRLTLYFREWISPLEELNRIMHLTDRPGLR